MRYGLTLRMKVLKVLPINDHLENDSKLEPNLICIHDSLKYCVF